MGTSNPDPHNLLAELKSRQEKRQGINDLLAHILPVVEAATKQPHPDFWVRQRLISWATYPDTLEAQTEHWMLTNDQRAALAKAFEKFNR
jgi:hypothetical protein